MKAFHTIIFMTMLLLPVQSLAQEMKPDGARLIFSKIQDDTASEIAANILAKIYSDIGIITEFQEFSAKESLVKSSQGSADGETIRISGLSTKHADLIQLTVPLITIEGRIYSIIPLPPFDNLKELSHLEFGLVKGIILADNKTKSLKRRFASNAHELFDLLVKDQLTIALMNNMTATIELSRHFRNKNIRPRGPVQYKVHLYHYLHKKNAHLVDRVEEAMKRSALTGEIEELYAKSLREIVEAEPNH